jgi:hypothetical protein
LMTDRKFIFPIHLGDVRGYSTRRAVHYIIYGPSQALRYAICESLGNIFTRE